MNFEKELRIILLDYNVDYLKKLLRKTSKSSNEDLINELLLSSKLDNLFEKNGASLFKFDKHHDDLIKRYKKVLNEVINEKSQK